MSWKFRYWLLVLFVPSTVKDQCQGFILPITSRLPCQATPTAITLKGHCQAFHLVLNTFRRTKQPLNANLLWFLLIRQYITLYHVLKTPLSTWFTRFYPTKYTLQKLWTIDFTTCQALFSTLSGRACWGLTPLNQFYWWVWGSFYNFYWYVLSPYQDFCLKWYSLSTKPDKCPLKWYFIT